MVARVVEAAALRVPEGVPDRATILIVDDTPDGRASVFLTKPCLPDALEAQIRRLIVAHPPR